MPGGDDPLRLWLPAREASWSSPPVWVGVEVLPDFVGYRK